MKQTLLIALVALLCSGCYFSEPEDYLHTVPTANNSTLIEDSAKSQMPMPTQF